MPENPKQADLRNIVQTMNNNTPLVLLPVRLETKFVKHKIERPEILGGSIKNDQLWVRIFPDNISVNSFQEYLTKNEIDAGKALWKDYYTLKPRLDRIELWRSFSSKYTKGRAKHILLKTKPSGTKPDKLKFPSSEKINLNLGPQPPKAKAFPEHFALLIRFQEDEPLKYIQTGKLIPKNIKLGPDPVILDPSLGSAAKMTNRHDIKVNSTANSDEIVYEDGLKWISDFDEAVSVGLGFKVKLRDHGMPENLNKIKQIMVVGLVNPENKNTAILEFDELLRGHSFSYRDLSLLPNGAPTNNTETADSFIEQELEKEFQLLFEPKITATNSVSDYWQTTDLKRLNSVLHLSPTTLDKVTDRKDISESRAMNTNLWSATWGNYLREFFPEQLTKGMRDTIRDFATEHVSARGILPNIRIGSQPYGFVVTSDFRNWESDLLKDPSGENILLSKLKNILQLVQEDWDLKLNKIPSMGETLPTDPEIRHAELVHILKNHPSAISYEKIIGLHQEIIRNYILMFGGNFNGTSPSINQISRNTFESLTGIRPENIDLSDHIVYAAMNARPVKSEKTQPTFKLSETEPLKDNYINWLRNMTNTSQLISGDFEKKDSLLFQLFRIAFLNFLNEEIHALLLNNGVAIDPNLVTPPALNIGAKQMTPLDYLNLKIQSLIPNFPNTTATTLAGNYMLKQFKTDKYKKFYQGLLLLENIPESRLERLMAEHIDLCSYRLDAWQTGFFNKRLREQQPNGYYTGAYGWLENLDLPKIMDPVKIKTTAPFESYSTDSMKNGPFIHSYSIPHANTAAVLYNAFKSSAVATPASSNPFMMDLSSRNVYHANKIIQGMRNGQSLSALLGYKLESFLLDSPDEYFSVGQHLLAFRKAYPIDVDPEIEQTVRETSPPRSVVHGLAFYDRVKFLNHSSGNPGIRELYPYDVLDLPHAASREAGFIKDVVERFFAVINALEDVLLSESVFQQVKGNTEKSGSVLDQISKAEKMLDPGILKTPRSGKTFTNRLAVIFDIDKNINYPFWKSITPRSMAGKNINSWIGKIIPDPQNILCYVKLGSNEHEVRFSELELEPLDLILMSDHTGKPEDSELGRWISYLLKRNHQITGKIPADIETEKRNEKWSEEIYSWAEISPLFAQLRNLILQSRPLHDADFTSATFSKVKSENYDLSTCWNSDGTGSLNLMMNSLSVLSRKLDKATQTSKLPLNAKTATEINETLEAIAQFGDSGAIPEHIYFNRDPDKEMPETDYNKQLAEYNELSEMILNQAKSVSVSVHKRLQEAETILAVFRQTDKDPLVLLENCTKAAKLLCGDSFSLLPTFRLSEAGAKEKSFSEENSLTAYCYNQNFSATGKAEINDSESSLVVNQWIQSTARIKANVSCIEQIQQYTESMGTKFERFHVAQTRGAKETGEAHWVAVEFPENYEIEGDKLSLVCSYSDYTQQAMRKTSGQLPLTGLVIEDWTESIPGKKETTAIAFNYNKPNSMPPQAVLIAVSPKTGADDLKWDWNNLAGILEDTLQRAKRRAISPDELENGPGYNYGAFLPAVFLPFSGNKSMLLTKKIL